MLDSKQCEAFLAVVETGSFELAGQQLCITPSAVTIRVQALEKNLGQLLLIRGRPCTITKAGQNVAKYLHHQRLLEQNLIQDLTGKTNEHFYKLIIASNADSLATWLLPTLRDLLIKERILLDIKLDDQSHTYSLLESGLVNACISIEPEPMNGCQAKYLGTMGYKLVATKNFAKQYFQNGVTREQLKSTPVIIFNEKDQLHFDLILKLFGLTQDSYPCFFIPSADSFLNAIKLGMGYGIVATLQLGQAIENGELVEILPEAYTEIPLYWHHWNKQTAQLETLTQLVLSKAKHILK